MGVWEPNARVCAGLIDKTCRNQTYFEKQAFFFPIKCGWNFFGPAVFLTKSRRAVNHTAVVVLCIWTWTQLLGNSSNASFGPCPVLIPVRCWGCLHLPPSTHTHTHPWSYSQLPRLRHLALPTVPLEGAWPRLEKMLGTTAAVDSCANTLRCIAWALRPSSAQGGGMGCNP